MIAPNVGNASEFISRALEDNAGKAVSSKTYADYIATRPRAQRFGSHGLFTDDGVEVKLNEVSEKLNQFQGNVWTAIISLRREDAERLGFNTGERWRDMLRSHTDELAQNFKIPLTSLKWYAAFHNESHHPHVHMVIYADDGCKPYLSKQGVMNLRSTLARDIFAQDLLCAYEKQTVQRDTLKERSHDVVADIVNRINNSTYDNPKLETLLLQLADRLSKTKGKKVYGYLKSDVKAIINNIVNELAINENIAALYDLWCEQKEEILRTYSNELPERIPLVDNPEFKSIKNAIIQEAMNISADHIVIDELDNNDVHDVEIPTNEIDQMESHTSTEKESSASMWRLYFKAKELLDKKSDSYNPNTAVNLLIEAANLGCGVAKYRLGKLFLRGDAVPKNIDYALYWLEESVSEGNQYAEYLLGKTLLKGEDVEQDLFRGEELLKRSAAKGNRYAKYTLGKSYLDGNLLAQDIPKAITYLSESADAGFAPAQYVYGKLLYKGEVMQKDILQAIKYLEGAAKQENSYAEYLLGKIYFFGSEVTKDYNRAIVYLNSAAEHRNIYAEQLLHCIHTNRNWTVSLGTLRLFHSAVNILNDRLINSANNNDGIDRKLRHEIVQKKLAHGLKL